MLIKTTIKTRKRLKIFIFFFIIGIILITLLALNNATASVTERSYNEERLLAKAYAAKVEQAAAPLLLKSPQHNGHIVPEKYDEHKLKTRIMQDKLKSLKEQQQQQNTLSEEEHTSLQGQATTAIHIFYSAPVAWYKSKKSTPASHPAAKDERLSVEDLQLQPKTTTIKPVRILNTAFYPALGLYKPTEGLLQKHFENIRNCGVGVLILSYTGKSADLLVQQQLLRLVPSYNLSITYELSVASNQSMDFLKQQLQGIRKDLDAEGFYKVFSQQRQAWLPVIYVSNAYKLSESMGRLLCHGHPDSLRHTLDAYFIGHIRLKNHAETLRRLCFDGFYSRLPSNGATYASTWKNWSYLKTFALTYKMLFVPTVGPGFAERNKFPRHGDIQRHRSNGRYYGVAWRTAIINHVGFINIASYNNWPEGSQIEEVIPKAGFLDYNPGKKTKYLDLTAHWVGNFLKTRQEAAAAVGQLNCYELLNNTIC